MCVLFMTEEFLAGTPIRELDTIRPPSPRVCSQQVELPPDVSSHCLNPSVTSEGVTEDVTEDLKGGSPESQLQPHWTGQTLRGAGNPPLLRNDGEPSCGFITRE